MTKFVSALAVFTAFLVVSASGCARSGASSFRSKTAPSFQNFLAAEAVSEPAPAPDQSNCHETCQKLRQELRYVVWVGKEIYCYWDLKKAETGTDFDALARELELSITDGTTATDYYVALRRWASAFHDGHVNAIMSTDHSNLEIYTAPVRLEVLAPATDHETVVVAETRADLGLSVGDQVTKIDGVPAAAAIDQGVLESSGSTPRMRRWAAAKRLVDVMGAARSARPLELDVVHGGAPLHVTLERAAELAAAPEPGKPSTPPTPTGAELIKALVLPGNLGYLRVDGFGGSQSFRLLDQAMQKLAATRGLLIDLRANGGGDQSGNSIIAWLIHSKVSRYRVSERMSDYTIAQRPEYAFLAWNPGAPFAEWHDLDVEPKAGATYAGKPVVALTSPHCFSACDTFTAGLKANGLATVVGEGTGGGTGTPLVFQLPVSDGKFRYSVVRGLTAKGETIEGNGTLPDIVLEPTLSERAAKKDTQLARALEVLGRQAGLERPAGEKQAELVATTLPAIWGQSLERSPTLSDEDELSRVLANDEL